jgi:protein required for attachment to host cells
MMTASNRRILSMPQKSKPTWLLVADGAAAQIYIVRFAPLRLHKLEGGYFKGKKTRTRDLESDRPGTSFESVGGARHAIQRRSDAHQRLEDQFTAHVAEFINAAARSKEFGRIAIAASPRALAELRKDLSAEAHGLVSLEVPADWTKLPHLDLVEHARAHMAVPAEA